MRTARKGAFALCAVAIAIAALMTFAVPSAAYADGSWTYDSTAKTLTSSSGVKLNDVTAEGSSLTIGNNTNRDDLGPSLDLQGMIGNGYTITAIGKHAFDGCSSLTSVEIPAGVETIGDYAFYGCTSLTSVTIPAGVETIGGYAFSGCTSLESVEIPNGVKTIGGRAFYGCTSLESVTIPASVKTIGGYAFSDCSSLESICVDGDSGKYSSQEGVLFSDGGETLVRFPGRRGGQYTIPASVTSIGDHAFDGCSFLTSVEIPANVETIGVSAFAGCSSLTSMTIPAGVTAIGDFAFSGCTSLASVTIPDGVKTIGNYAFFGCSSLTSVKIPDGVTAIESSAFAYCSSLTSVEIPDGVTSIGASAFNSCSSLTSVTIPYSVGTIGNYAFSHCSSLRSICVDGSNEYYLSKGGVLFSKDGGTLTLVCFPGGKGGRYEIPGSVTAIRTDAFSYCTSLTSVKIPDSVTSIGDFAFAGCSSLTSICVDMGNESYSSMGGVLFSKGDETLVCFPGGMGGRYEIPGSVETIGNYAFFGCSSLTSVEIPAGVTSIGVSAFNSCSSFTSVEIPASVTSIGSSAFNSCSSLERVTVLAENPPTLYAGVFASCDPNLTIVVHAGYLEKYSKENNWNGLAGNLTAGYSLKVQGDSGTELDLGLYADGDEVQVSANVEVGEGQHVKWVLSGNGSDQPETVTYNTLTMPNRDATVICKVEPHSFSGRYCVCGAENPNYVPPAPTYSSEVTVSDNGTASVSPARASAGQKVTVACSPSEGFEVRSVLVSGRDGEPVEATDNGDGTWTFVMPDNGAEISVVFGCDGGALCPSAGYSDVDQSLWYHDAVDAVVSAGLMTGYAGGSGLFGPDDELTRAQAAAVLCRALGTGEPAPACGMADVDPGAWYAGSVDWAMSSGIMVGYGDGSGRFGVDDALTREQLATVLWRAAGSPDAGAYDGSAFSDGADASGWAEPALAWAVGTGVLKGSDDGSGGTELRPTAAITRAEMAAMLERWLLLG